MRAQSRRMSLVAAVTNVVVGFAVALLTQIAVFPIFELQVSLADNLAIGAAFTAISLARSFALRRLLTLSASAYAHEAIRVRGTRTITAGPGARRHRPW